MSAEDLKVFLQILEDYGIIGILILILFYLVAFPEKAEKLKILVLSPTYKLFKWGSKQYISTKISSHSTEFIRRHLKPFMPHLADFRISIKWITSDSEAILKENNTLILRLQETNDQTRNTLAATRIALPKVICPNLRSNIKEYAGTAIDLTILKKMADKLGKYAGPIYQKYFLLPELEQNTKAAKLITKLLAIDKIGIFIAIFLEELENYGSFLYSKGILEDRTDEVVQFLEFLVPFAEREVGEEIQLDYNSQDIALSIILLAKSIKAETQGVAPYVKRIKKYASLGYESIYIYAYSPARDFLSRLVNSIEGDNYAIIDKRVKLELHNDNEPELPGIAELVKLRTVKLYDSSFIEDRLASVSLKEGDVVEGTIIDVSHSNCMVDIKGVTAIILLKDCSWYSNKSCHNLFKVGDTSNFFLKSINKDINRVYLSRKFPEDNPLTKYELPPLNTIINVRISEEIKNNLIARFNELEITIPFREISWLPEFNSLDNFINEQVQVKIINVSVDDEKIIGSIRQAIEDPWPQLQQDLKKGKEYIGEVVEMTGTIVKVVTPDGLPGFIIKESMEKAGYEYKNYLQTFVKGQKLEVVVSKVFKNRRTIRFELKRNIK